ncbi:LytTR family transcriptional regulator DNA-binding domain-containing protein [Companilactobacillus mishanensis]|uniref:ABC transporter ATP-binding protein n=1 Tax=Companilactobacillus mishanensis TaxID=2486008 RepID=A0ABW9P7M2_9LACO|nr:LytTR family transcriptional regulator DNA-binding domain-containing protein [Companilactobacillus mishanensis]MQS45062.1 ABC transporter ATP-binding protein [Companilactobacillus mishanensis]
MSLVSLEKVMKQDGGQVILKNIDLEVASGSKIGIKMTHKESLVLFKLITGKMVPTSGHIVADNTNTILSEIIEDGLYDSLTVKAYLKFFQTIVGKTDDLDKLKTHFSLEDFWKTKIKHLTANQRERINLFRMFMFSPKLILIESPLRNLTNDGIELYLKALDYVRSNGITVLCTSYYTEELIILSDTVYRYNQNVGLEKTDLKQNVDVSDDDSEASFMPKRVFKVACNIADKTVFFSPDEIDFIESVNGVSNIRIGNEYFPSALTMNDLEEKLNHFGFYRCHRSYLVNLQRISELISYSRNSYTLILKGKSKEKLPLSRTRLDELRKLIEN